MIASRLRLLQYLTIYAVALTVCWASLATLLRTGGKYVSVLSWNLFGLEELIRSLLGARDRGVMTFETFLASIVGATVCTMMAVLINSKRLRLAGIVAMIVIGVAAAIWFPNPWLNM